MVSSGSNLVGAGLLIMRMRSFQGPRICFARSGSRYRTRRSTTETSSKSPDKLDGRGLDMDMPEGECGIFKDCWAKYKGITAVMVTDGIGD